MSTRDMVLAAILAHLVAAVAGALVDVRHDALDTLARPVADVLCATLLTLLVMLGGKQPLKSVVAATSLDRNVSSIGPALWIPIALLAGLLLRFGASGIALGVVQMLPHAPPTRQAIDLIDIPAASLPGIGPVLICATLLGAASEEFVFRRVLQSYFCRKFGLVAGILGVSTVFGAIHLSPVVILVGICLALLYLYSGRLWVAILAHATGNLSVYAMAMLQPRREAVFVGCCVATLPLIAALIFVIRAIRKSPGIYGRSCGRARART